METQALCPHCHRVQQVRVNGCFPVLVTHLNVGVYCPGSRLLVTTDADVLATMAARKAEPFMGAANISEAVAHPGYSAGPLCVHGRKAPYCSACHRGSP